MTRPAAPRPKRPAPRLGASEPVASGLYRLLSEEIGGARADLDAITHDAAPAVVHAVRRRIKRARTIVRLLRPAFGEAGAAVVTPLRAAAKALAGPRDALVLAETAKGLIAEARRPAERDVLQGVVASARRRAARRRVPADDVAVALADLARAAAALDRLDAARLDDAAVGARVARLYRRARASWRAAERAPGTEALHDWRRLVKDRLHVVRLFAARWPEPTGRRERRLDELGEVLGRDHDLALLADALPAADPAAPKLKARIARRRKSLEEKAFRLAGTVFAPRPKRVARAWTM